MPSFRLAALYIGDANYHELTLYSLASLARSHRAPLDLYLMQSGYETAVDADFERYITSLGHRLITRPVAFEAPEAGSRQHAKTYTYITDTMFLKAAAIEALCEQYDYILYLDGDMLVFDDLGLDKIAGFPETAAACVDLTVAGWLEEPWLGAKFRRETVTRTALFNSGILVVNASEWRRRGTYRRFLECLAEHKAECPYFETCEPNEQCALNMALAGTWRPLDITFNVQKVALHTRAWSEARVRHYSGRNKFLPLRMHRCDEREYALLSAISREAGLPDPGLHDRGLSYWLNGIRRQKDVRRLERAIARISASEP